MKDYEGSSICKAILYSGKLNMFCHTRARVADCVQWLGYGLNNRGNMVQCLAGAKYFFSSPKYADGSESLPASCAVVGEVALSGVKRLEREADRSPPSSTAVENDWIYSSIPPIYLMFYTRKTFIFHHSAL
jgi:hypothetical protein